MATATVTIAGVTMTGDAHLILRNTLRYTDAQGQRNTADFSVVSKDGSYIPHVGQAVTITDGVATVFGGTIDSVTKVLTTVAAIESSCACVSWEQTLYRRTCGGRSYESQTAGAILRDLITNCLGSEGFTSTGVQDGPTIDFFATDYESVGEAADAIREQTGLLWDCTPAKDVRLYPAANYTAPWSITDAEINTAFPQITVTETREKYFNRVIGRFTAYLLPAVAESFSGDGSKQSFDVSQPIQITPTVKVNTVTKTVGIRGIDSGKDWYWLSGTTLVDQDTGGTILTSGDTLEITFQPSEKRYIILQDDDAVDERSGVEGGTGYCEKLIEFTDPCGPDQATAILQAQLDHYAAISRSVDCQTLRRGLASGQNLTINHSKIGVNGTFLVEAVTMRDLAKQLAWSAKAVDGAVIGDWKQDLATLSRGVSGVSGGTVVLSGGSAGGGAAADANPPTAVTVTVLGTDTAEPYALRIAWDKPSPLGGTVGYDREYRMFTDSDCTTPDTEWTPLGVMFGGNLESVDGDWWTRPSQDLWVKARVRGVNADNSTTSWVDTAAAAKIDAGTGSAGDIIPVQPGANDWSVAVYEYGRDVQTGKQVAHLQATATTHPVDADYFKVWQYEGTSAPADPASYIDVCAKAIPATGDTVLDWWVDRDSANRTFQIVLTACNFTYTKFPTAASPHKQVVVNSIANSPQVTGFSVTLQQVELAGVPSGKFIYNFTEPADPEYWLVNIYRIACDSSYTPLGGATYGIVAGEPHPTSQIGYWTMPTTAEYWKFKACAVNHSEVENQTNAPTYNLTVPASAGLNPERLDPSKRVTGAQIATGTITTGNIADATIVGGDLANATITGTQIASATITGANIANATITGTQIASATITGANIQDASITGTDIAAATITGGNIGSATITGTNIGSGTITGTNIQDASITGTDIAAATIHGSNIASATITGANVGSGTITGGNIASATITGSNIGTGAITGTNIASATITGANIAAATISGSNIGSATITGGNMAAATITGSLIASGTITGGNIANATITGTQIGTGAIIGTHIAAASITATHIVDATITAAEIANGTITATQIANATITGAKLANATVTATQIAAATITATQIAAATITATNIANATITGTQIASASITSTHINGTITGDHIGTITTAQLSGVIQSGGNVTVNANAVTGVIVSSQIADGIINAVTKFDPAVFGLGLVSEGTQLRISTNDTSNMCMNGAFEFGLHDWGDGVERCNLITADATGGIGGSKAAKMVCTGLAQSQSLVPAKEFPCNPTDAYTLEVWVKSAAGTTGQLATLIRFRNSANGTTGDSTWSYTNPTNNVWTKVTVPITAAPANTVKFTFWAGYSGSSVGTWYFDNVVLARAVDASRISSINLTTTNFTGIMASGTATINANMITGTLSAGVVGNISIASLSGTLSAAQCQSISIASFSGTISQLSGTLSVAQCNALNIGNFSGSISQLNAGTVVLTGQWNDSHISAVSCGKLIAGEMTVATVGLGISIKYSGDSRKSQLFPGLFIGYNSSGFATCTLTSSAGGQAPGPGQLTLANSTGVQKVTLSGSDGSLSCGAITCIHPTNFTALASVDLNGKISCSGDIRAGFYFDFSQVNIGGTIGNWAGTVWVKCNGMLYKMPFYNA